MIDLYMIGFYCLLLRRNDEIPHELLMMGDSCEYIVYMCTSYRSNETYLENSAMVQFHFIIMKD